MKNWSKYPLYLLACISLLGISNVPCPLSPMRKRAEEVALKANAELAEKYGLAAIHIDGTFEDKIENLTLGFLCNKRKTHSNTRNLVIRLAEEFRERVNAYDPIQCHLRRSPMDSDMVRLYIIFKEEPFVTFCDPFVSMVCLENGEITYSYTDHPSAPGFSRVQRETFEQAYAIYSGGEAHEKIG